MAMGESVSEDMAWSLAWGVGGLLLLAWALRTLNWAWWTPRRLERALRAQGLNGTPYRFPNGDFKENIRLAKEASSTPMPLTHDIVPRVLPFLRRAIDEYVPRVTIMDPELVREVLSNKFGHFGKPKGSPLGRLFLRGLVSYEGEKWVKHRRIMNPAFHVEKLKRMLPAFCACCSDLMSRWENLVGSEACYELDVWPELQSFTGDVISRTAFGGSCEEGRRIFQLQAEQAELLIQTIQNLYIPGYRFLPTPKKNRLKAADREIRALLRGIIKKREQAMKLGKASNDDLLGLLMESNLEYYQEHGNKNAGITPEDVIDECKLFYFAGQETTSVLLTWTMIVLSMHPSWQVRARQEVLQVFGERKPDFDGLSRLKNVTMILYEVLRLYPPAVFLQRQTYKTMKLGDVIYPPGVTLLMPIIFIHHDLNYWGKDANEFNPERFAEGISKASKDHVAFFPFGGGPRICIGQNFALLEAKMGLSFPLLPSPNLLPAQPPSPRERPTTRRPQCRAGEQRSVCGRSIELKLEERRRMAAQQPQQQQQVANSFTSQFAVMSKAQLYDILSQMKALIEQNQQEARQILIDNPLLTRALFQAQIMLGMVQSPKVMSNTQQALQQPQPAQVGQPQIVHSLQTVPAKVGEQSEPGSSQSLLSARQQHPTQPSISLPLASGSSQSLLSARQQRPTQPSISLSLASGSSQSLLSARQQHPTQPSPLSEPQTKGFLNLQVPSVTPIQSSQIQNISQPNPAAPHYSNLPSHLPMISVHPQQTLQNPGLFNQLLQPPFPLQPRQVTMQPFAIQFHPQMPHSLGLQPSSASQQLLSQPLFHVGSSHMGTDYGTQVSTSMQKDRGAPWVLGSSEITTVGTQLPGLPPMISGQIATGAGGQPPRPPPLTPEMEKALLQQVMGLTPEQINLLPPEQRNQTIMDHVIGDNDNEGFGVVKIIGHLRAKMIFVQEYDRDDVVEGMRVVVEEGDINKEVEHCEEVLGDIGTIKVDANDDIDQ
ncbi:superfamily of TFs having WRKY and zinc finger domains [Musa troglodytarum]|uniref:Superfamily of TFs having WRKY and zinc finger domains n=1 Tax=Musa troglodytarum TaxID=320322 RepID=A0A9E7GNI6_9LILI|nr:superfamily of TFs having WRKY and zinc finger domains [Musa troglodytarum]